LKCNHSNFGRESVLPDPIAGFRGQKKRKTDVIGGKGRKGKEAESIK